MGYTCELHGIDSMTGDTCPECESVKIIDRLRADLAAERQQTRKLEIALAQQTEQLRCMSMVGRDLIKAACHWCPRKNCMACEFYPQRNSFQNTLDRIYAQQSGGNTDGNA